MRACERGREGGRGRQGACVCVREDGERGREVAMPTDWSGCVRVCVRA